MLQCAVDMEPFMEPSGSALLDESTSARIVATTVASGTREKSARYGSRAAEPAVAVEHVTDEINQPPRGVRDAHR